MNKIKKAQFISLKMLAILVVIVALVVAFVLLRSPKAANKVAASNQSAGPKINLDGPTVQEKQSGNNTKDVVIEQEKARNSTPTSDAAGKKTVTPLITYADQHGDQIEVGAYVTGVFEDGGTCTLTLNKGSTKQTVSVTAVKDVSSVDCPVMVIKRSSLEAGTWQTSVTYDSTTSQGTSTPGAVEVK